MKKVLIGIDYAPSAQKIAEEGYQIGRAMAAEVVLVHVIEDVTYYASSIYDPIMGFTGFVNLNFLGPDVLESIENEANLFLDKIKIHLDDPTIQKMVTNGEIANSILETARQLDCHMIIIGTKSRRSRMEEFFLGSSAHKILRNVTVPLCIIPI